MDKFQDAVDRVNARKHTALYRKASCPICGRIISESAYSGRSGNIKKHIASHQ